MKDNIARSNTILNSNPHPSSVPFWENAVLLFELLYALWGTEYGAEAFFPGVGTNMMDEKNFPEVLARKNAVTNWLKNSVLSR
jgi:hypothetical protein